MPELEQEDVDFFSSLEISTDQRSPGITIGGTRFNVTHNFAVYLEYLRQRPNQFVVDKEFLNARDFLTAHRCVTDENARIDTWRKAKNVPDEVRRILETDNPKATRIRRPKD